MPAALPMVAAAFVAVGSAATAIGLGTAFMIGATAVTWGAVLTVTGVALMAVTALTMKSAKPDSSGGQLDVKLDPKAPVPVLYGRSATGGYAIYKETYGSKNKYAAIVCALSIGPIMGVEAYAANDRPLSFYGDPHVGVYNTAGYADSKLYRGKFRMRYQRGETPAPQTIEQAAGGGLPKSPGKLSGIAHAIKLLEYDADQFPQGMPKSRWTVKGVKLYDPRKDSTYPGGSGTHRRANHASWEYSENPYLAALDWTLGRFFNGKKVYGIGAKWEEVDLAAFVAGANVADANGWKVGGVVVTSDDKMAVLGTLLESGGGVPIARGAQISCMVNTPKVSTLTLTSADVIGEVEIQHSTSWRDRSNTVIPSYREESQLWEIIAGEAVSTSVYVEEDGGETKTIEVEYPLVQQAAQAHQLAVYELCNSREFLTFRVTCGVRMLAAKVGEAITVNLPEINANGRKCLVVSREFNPSDWSVTLGFKSETDAKHPFALGQSQVAPPSPALSGYNPAEPGAPGATAWSITATTIQSEGVVIPAIVVSGEVDDPNAAEILIEYRPTGSTAWINWGSFAKNTRQIEITAVTRNTAYDVAVSYKTVLGVTSDRLILGGTAGEQKIDWGSGVIVGDNKPADNATVGAPNGTNVGGKPAEQVIDAISNGGIIIKSRDLQTEINAAKATIAAIQGSVSADFSAVNRSVGTLQSDVSTAKSNISSLQSSASSLNSSVSTLQSDVSAAKTNITNLQSSTGTLNSSVSTLQSDVSAAKTNVSNLQSQASGIISSVNGLDTRITAQGGQISTMNSTLSTQGSNISSLQTTVSNTSGDVATLKTQINAGGGNLLVNTDLANGSSAGWAFRSQNNMLATGAITGQPIDYQVPGENNFSIVQPNTASGTAYAEWYQTISIEGGKWYDVSGWYGAHRCTAQVFIQWVLDSGAIGAAPNTGVLPTAVTGNSLSAWARYGFKTQAPANAVRANILLRKRPTDAGSDSWVWFIRPQVSETTASSASPLAYAPGSARASIVQQAQALSTLDTTVSSLSSTVASQGGSITNLQSSVTTLTGTVSTMSSTVSAQGSSISTLQSASSTAAGQISTLQTQVNAGSGNLLTNTDFAVDASGWSFGLQNSAVADHVTGTDQWMVTGENGVRLFQPNATTTGYAEWEQFFAVVSGKWYDTSVRVAAHRCQVQVYVSWRDSSNATISSPSSGLITPLTGGSLLDNWTHIGFKAQAPANAVRARIVLRKFGTLAGSSEPNSYAWFLRPQVAETFSTSASPLAYAPGSARASIDTQAQTLKTATSSLATLSSTVSTQGGSITTLQSSFTGLNGTVSTLSSTVSTQGASITSLQSASTTQAGQISTLNSTVSTQGGSITTLQSSMTSAQGNISTLQTQVSAGGGNLLVNTDAAVDLSGWTFGSTHSATFGRNLPGSAWAPANENTLTIVQANATTTGISDITQIVEVAAGKWYDVSAYCASHRCAVEVIIQWIDSANNSNLGAPSSGQFAATGGGNDLSKFVIRSVKAQAPAGAVRARFYLRKAATTSGQTDSYAWFLRPQVVETLAGSATPVTYSPGSARASIVQQAQALSTLNSSFSTLSSTVSTQGGSISTLQSSMTSAQGSISTLQSNVSTQGTNISSLQTASTTQAGQIATLNSTVSTQGSSITSNGQAINTLNSSVASLNTVVAASSSPNLIQNGGFENGLRGWTAGGRNPNGWTVNNWAWGYWASNSGYTGSSGNNYTYIDSAEFGATDAGSFTFSFDFDFQGGAGCVCYGEYIWYDANRALITSNGSVQSGPKGFDVTGNSRFKHTRTPPSGTAFAKARIVFYAPTGVTINAVNVRQVKMEFGTTATPYSGEATAGQMYQAYATLDSSFASLSTTVSSQGGSISTLQSSYTGLNGTVSTLNSTVSAQGSSISSLQSASSTQAGQISTIQTQLTAGGGNLLVNSDLAIDTSGWSFAASNGSVGDRVGSGDQWIVTGENGLRITQANTNSANQADWTQEIAVEQNKWYDVSVYAASHRADIQIYLQFINASGTVVSTPSSGRLTPNNAAGTALSNFTLRSFKGQAPAGTARAKLYLRKFGTITGADSYAWFLRPQIAETAATSATPIAYSPGSARASISSQASAISTLTSQQASLSTTVGTQGSTISSQATAITSLQGSVGTLQSTVSAQAASITSLQTASSTTNGNVASLTTTVNAGAPNLLRYGGFQAGKTGWPNAGAAWIVAGETDPNWGRFMTINATGNSYCNTEPQACQVGQQYTISCDIDRGGTSGGLVAARIIWRNSAGGTLAIGGVASKASGGFSNSEGDRVFGSSTCPSGAVDFYVQLVVEGVTGSQYWRRIKVNTGTTPGRYSEEASVVQSFNALSTLTSQYASLNSTVGTLNSSVTTQQTAINNLQGRTTAYWQVTAVAGGRAQMTVYADANGGGGVDIVGDLRVHGNAMITGTINPEALSLGRFVKRVNGAGSGSPNPGETRLLYAQDIGDTSANGSYLIELNGSMTTTVGRQNGNYNNRQFYVNHLPDGGLLVRLNKNGSTIHETYIQAEDLVSQNSVGNKTVSLYRNIVVDSPGGSDGATGNATILIYAIKGNQDTGIVNNGDYYSQNVSANYHAFSVTAKTKWTFI